MSSRKRSSSGSEEDERYAMMDERKRKRMISNRESARRSRMKREQHMKDLNEQIIVLSRRSKEIMLKINDIMQRYAEIESDNRILMALCDELRKRLESAEMVSSFVSGASESGNSMDVPLEPWIEPWQPPVQFLPILTSDVAFQF